MNGRTKTALVGVLVACALFLHPMAGVAAMSYCAPGPIDFNTAGGIGDTGWVINPNDFLVVTGASSQVNERLNINLRFVAEDTTLFDQIQLPLTAGDRSVQQVKYDFGPLFNNLANRTYSKQVFMSDISIEAVVATTRGQTFARVNLYRFGTSLNQDVKPIAKCAILSDYVTQQVTACLRNARHFTSIEGQGNIRTILDIVPVQTDWIFTVPANARWKVRSIFGQLQTDATVGTRTSILVVKADGLDNTWGNLIVAAPPSVTIRLNASSALSDNPVTSGTITWTRVSLPWDLTLLPTGFVESSTNFPGPADAWSFVGIVVEEWLDNV